MITRPKKKDEERNLSVANWVFRHTVHFGVKINALGSLEGLVDLVLSVVKIGDFQDVWGQN